MMNSERILEIFKEITRIPRESGHEEQMQAYLQDFARAHALACRTDAVGNVCITKEPAPGKEQAPTLVLQGHQDMVCEKLKGSAHDFGKDPIEYVIEDGWMIAKETTLGADDGIGVAAMLALLESDLPTGRLECVFTVSEETGMDGAFGMEPGFFTGRTLINLDSEDEGQLFIGCAGGLDTFATFRYTTGTLRPGYKTAVLRIAGALGGHSGDDIDKERINAVQTMARFLDGEYPHGLQLIHLEGGGKPNAIARECEAVVAVPDPAAAARRFAAFGEEVRAEHFQSDPDARFTCETAPAEMPPMADADALRLIRALFACPHGVEAMSQDIPGLVETSTNLASIRMEEGVAHIVTSQRSATASARRMMGAKVAAHFLLAGAEVDHASEYPGWKPNLHSRILEVSVASYRALFRTEPEVKAIHAGLECGLFGEKFGDLDMISFGPTLRGVHTPGERLDLASLEKFTRHLADVVIRFQQ